MIKVKSSGFSKLSGSALGHLMGDVCILDTQVLLELGYVDVFRSSLHHDALALHDHLRADVAMGEGCIQEI